MLNRLSDLKVNDIIKIDDDCPQNNERCPDRVDKITKTRIWFSRIGNCSACRSDDRKWWLSVIDVEAMIRSECINIVAPKEDMYETLYAMFK